MRKSVIGIFELRRDALRARVKQVDEVLVKTRGLAPASASAAVKPAAKPATAPASTAGGAP